MKSHSLLFVFFFALQFGLAQKYDRLYMNNGEYVQGKIIAIGTQVVLVKLEDRVQSVPRSDVKYVFSQASNEMMKPNTTASSKKNDWFKPINKTLVTELGGGIYLLSPFTLNMSLTEWYYFSPRTAVGLMVSADFGRYAAIKFSAHVRRFFNSKSRSSKSFVTTSFGFAPFPGNFLNQALVTTEPDFSPMIHPTVGGGIWLDTGFKLAFIFEGGLSLTMFKLTEQIGGWQGASRTQTTSFFGIGPYMRMSMAF